MFKRLMQRFALLEGEGATDAPAGNAQAAAPAAGAAETSTAAAPTPPGNLVAEATAATDAASATTTETPADGNGEPPKEAGKEGEQKDGTTTEPAQYTDFKLPDGVQADEKLLGSFKDAAKEAGLSQEQAQKLVDMHSQAVQEASNANMQLWYDTQKEWQQAVIKDPEIGGKNFEPMKETIAKAIDLVGGEDAAKIRQAFDYTGAGNNPDIIRFLFRLGNAIGEGGSVGGGKPAAVEQPVSAAQRLYPNQSQTNQ